MRSFPAAILTACTLFIVAGTGQPQDKTPAKPPEKKAADLGKPQQFKFGEEDFLLIPAQLSRKELHGMTTLSDKVVLTNKDGKKFNLEGMGSSVLNDAGIDTGDGKRFWGQMSIRNKDGTMVPVLGWTKMEKGIAGLVFTSPPGTEIRQYMPDKKVYWGGVNVFCGDSMDVPPPEPPSVLLLFRYKGPQEDLAITVPDGRKIKL